MAKISKPVLKRHNEALKILEKKDLDFNDRDFVYKNYHEGAGKMNNLISAHFTPYSIAHSMTFNISQHHFVDLCAGIGILSYALLRQYQMGIQDENKPTGICIENCVEYYEIGKKLLPDFHWINGSIFDIEVIEEVKTIMKGKEFSIISNPPYGAQVKTDCKDLLKYSGSTFEYKAIELGAILGASDGAFLIPQVSCPFRMSGVRKGGVYDDEYKTTEYLKFVKQTELEIISNIGFSTDINDEDDNWRDVSIVTEIAIIEYSEHNYKSLLTIAGRIHERAKTARIPVLGGYVDRRESEEPPSPPEKQQYSLFD